MEVAVKSDRKSRSDSIRAAELRSIEIRKSHVMDIRSPLNIPLEIVPEGWHYAWIRIGTLDLPDHAREVQTKAMGYTPVPSERHLYLCMSGHLGEVVHNNCIIYRNLLLCEIPLIEYQAYRNEQNQRFLKTMQAINAMNFINDGNRMGVKVLQLNNKTSFGSDFPV